MYSRGEGERDGGNKTRVKIAQERQQDDNQLSVVKAYKMKEINYITHEAFKTSKHI